MKCSRCDFPHATKTTCPACDADRRSRENRDYADQLRSFYDDPDADVDPDEIADAILAGARALDLQARNHQYVAAYLRQMHLAPPPRGEHGTSEEAQSP